MDQEKLYQIYGVNYSNNATKQCTPDCTCEKMFEPYILRGRIVHVPAWDCRKPTIRFSIPLLFAFMGITFWGSCALVSAFLPRRDRL